MQVEYKGRDNYVPLARILDMIRAGWISNVSGTFSQGEDGILVYAVKYESPTLVDLASLVVEVQTQPPVATFADVMRQGS